MDTDCTEASPSALAPQPASVDSSITAASAITANFFILFLLAIIFPVSAFYPYMYRRFRAGKCSLFFTFFLFNCTKTIGTLIIPERSLLSSKFPAKNHFTTNGRINKKARLSPCFLLSFFFRRLRVVFQTVAGLTVQHLADGRQRGEPDGAVKCFLTFIVKYFMFSVLPASAVQASSFKAGGANTSCSEPISRMISDVYMVVSSQFLSSS